MATHAGHATGIDQVQGLEGGATPGPLGQLWAPSVDLGALKQLQNQKKKRGNSRCFCSKAVFPTHLLFGPLGEAIEKHTKPQNPGDSAIQRFRQPWRSFQP